MRLSLKEKLFAGIGSAVLLVLLLSFLSYYTSLRQRDAETWVAHTVEVKTKLKDLSLGLKDYTANIRTLRRYSNTDVVYKDISPEIIKQRADELSVLVSDNPEQAQSSESMLNKLDGLLQFWNRIDLNKSKADQEQEKEYYLEEIKQISAINAVIHEMEEHEDVLMAKRRAQTLRLLGLNNWLNLGGTLLIIIIVIVLCYATAREFTKRKRAEDNLQDNLEELEQINTKTRNHNEILNGVQQLTEACQKSNTVPQFLKSTLESIISFLRIPSGVIYLCDEENTNLLIPQYSSGVNLLELKQIDIKELPATEAIGEQGVAIISNVPPGFWKSHSSLGSSQPGALAYLFLKQHSELLAVIELGNFISFSAQQTEYLQMVNNTVSVRLSAVQAQQSRDSLFEQLQEKQEMLINQQEELRLANDELTQQTHTLQASEEELRVQEEELKEINIELEEKNEALEAAREVLSLKASELEVSGKYKSEFLANMSHELRTPLNSVLILAGLLSDNKDNNLTERQIEYANIIHKSGSDLLNLINDILDLSKIESGKVDLVIEKFQVASLAEDMRQLFFVVAEESGIHFSTKIEEDVPDFMVSDKQRLEQVIKNLLSNAFKFTPRGGAVSLAIGQPSGISGQLVIEVADTGIGIPAGKQPHIFEAFKQADGSTNRKYGGTGLGLSISRELVRLLGGNITLSSEEHKGSRFTLFLPQEYATTAPGLQRIATAGNHTPEHTVPVGPQQLSLDPTGKTIMIVEDDINFASILNDFATERGYNTIHATNGKEALDLAGKELPDAIILDMQMPVMDGWEVLTKLKEDVRLSQIPVHIISASDDVQFPARGAIAHLKKPVSKEGLTNAFALIGIYLQNRSRKLLILSGTGLTGKLLEDFTRSIPGDVTYEIAHNYEECLILGREQVFDCIIADIGSDIDSGIAAIQDLKETNLFKSTSVILFIDKEISSSDEIKLKKISEAVIMNSAEVQRRLSDELDLFLYKVNEKTPGHLTKVPNILPFEKDVLKGKKVLVADDDMRNVFALVSLLEGHEIEVVTASNGREAIELLANGEKPDLVLMDIMMPEMDGYEAMQHIRAKLRLSRLPIIAVTAKAMTEDRELCIEAGASDYISKPVDAKKLLSLMRVWLSQ
jgi:signal transduction histidine kinase/CheY-like chemotaxis protein/CHASE3 domain sensor protein